nr:hypothetical protein [Tanacetum cinerariifolium]
MLQSPNDDRKDTSVEDGSMQPSFDIADSAQENKKEKKPQEILLVDVSDYIKFEFASMHCDGFVQQLCVRMTWWMWQQPTNTCRLPHFLRSMERHLSAPSRSKSSQYGTGILAKPKKKKLFGIDMILMDEDVIGRLVKNNNITVMDPEDKAKHLLEFKLQDLSGVMVPCTLRLYITLKLHGIIKDNATSNEPIILLILMEKQSMWNFFCETHEDIGLEDALAVEDVKAEENVSTVEDTSTSTGAKRKTKAVKNMEEEKPCSRQLVLVGSLRPDTQGRWFDSAGGLYIPSATSTADVAAMWTCGTQSADVALPRGVTWDQHADVAADEAADVALSEWATWQPDP